MKSYLVLMPFFMEYEKSICNEFKKRYEVTLYDNEKDLYEIDKYIQDRFWLRVLRQFFLYIKKLDVFYEHMENKFADKNLDILLRKKYDEILCINGHLLADKVYRSLKENNPDTKMRLYLWDDAKILRKNTHFKYFDEVMSFNMDECKKYGFKYMPMFTQHEWIGHAKQNKYDLALIGTAHPDRIKLAKEIYEKYKEKYKMFIYFYHPDFKPDFFGHTESLKYKEYLKILQESHAVLDLPLYKQVGLTTRPFDALLTDTKVITTNKYITEYPVYSENISVIDRENPVIDDAFMTDSYVKNDKHAISVREWLDNILKD